jgi:hypothetical protein
MQTVSMQMEADLLSASDGASVQGHALPVSMQTVSMQMEVFC